MPPQDSPAAIPPFPDGRAPDGHFQGGHAQDGDAQGGGGQAGDALPPAYVKPRQLLTRLREVMATGRAPLATIVQVVATEIGSDVCSVYAMRPGDLLELVATEGLRQSAVGRTRLRVGEGIVGIAAATGKVKNLADAQYHPAFAWRSETGEEPYASLLAIPLRRAGRTQGVLVVQSRAPRRFGDVEVEALQIVAMVVAECLTAAGTPDGAEQGLASTLPRRFPGTRLVGGIAVGPLIVHGSRRAPQAMLAEDSEAELARLAAAMAAMRAGLDDLIDSSMAAVLPDAADDEAGSALSASREVLEAYRLVAADAGWIRRVEDAVRSGLTAEAAVHRVAGDLRDRMRRITDPYLRERVADLEDLAGRLLAALGGEQRPESAAGAILVARRLGPADLLDWHARGIGGLVIEEASHTGHAAIIARALGLPTLSGLRGVIEAVERDDCAVLDADEGGLLLRPDAEVESAYRRAIAASSARAAEVATLRDHPAVTADGTALKLLLNVGLPLELDQLAISGADGIGLFRSEIPMLARGLIPDVAEQTDIYRRVLDAVGERPALLRTLDLGGDKLLPDAPAPVEENPAMGWRSLRVQLDRPSLLRRQLRAMLLAADGRDLSVMFPMVATVAEFRTARALLLAECGRVTRPPARLAVGAMLEVPALMWQLDELLRDADFLSVGSNDLMQFLFAADRSNPDMALRYDLLSPPMLDLLDQLRQRCDAAGRGLSVCGDVASRPLEALTLVGLGITSLSMPGPSILPVKALLAGADIAAFARVLTAHRRTAAGAASLREPIAAWAREHGLLA